MASDYTTIEEIIRSHLQFKVNSIDGWNTIFCEVCGDGKRTKPPRGGWLFSDEMVFFHCFNCGIECNFDPNREIPYSKDMDKTFKAFGIPKKIITQLIFSKKKDKNFKEFQKPQRLKQDIKEIEIPDHFYKLSDADDNNIIANNAKKYLIEKRFINPSTYTFYLSTGITNNNDPKNISLAKVLFNRLIIPSFKQNKMVYYIARALDENSKLPYINANVPKSNIIYGFAEIYRNTEAPLFILEGFFDAFHLNGVAVLENRITKNQIDILNFSKRKKVVVPDRMGDSKKLAEQALELGWAISIPDIGTCKDVTEGIKKYGKLYVIDSVMKNIKEGNAAKIKLKSFNL